MIKSMTGYGKAEGEYQSKKISLEIKSLNSKQLDLSLRLPSKYKEKELELRNEISKELVRGKVDLFVSLDTISEEMSTNINSTVINAYFQQISNISKDLNIPLPSDILSTILRLPDTFKAERQELTDDEWIVLQGCLSRAIKSLNEFRDQEGKALAKDIIDRVQLIDRQAIALEPFEVQRIEKLKLRIKQNLAEIVGSEKIDENRFEQELIYYIEKLDITEEKVRLSNHCSYFIDTMNEPESNGKKLGFIVQEIGREINTIGSKANDAEMQKIVIGMKDELEKIKEQINNIL